MKEAERLRIKWDRTVEIKRNGRDLYKLVQTTPHDQLRPEDKEAFNAMVRELNAIDKSATYLEEIP